MNTLVKLLLATLALALAGAAPASASSQYGAIDYYVQQMIAAAITRDPIGVLTFREQLENLRRPEGGDPWQARPFNQLGQEQLADGRFKQALLAFRQGFIADPTDPEIADHLGLTYLRLHRLKEAERLLVYALSLAPARATTWLHLGQVYGQTGDTQRTNGAFANAHRFAADQPRMIEQLRQLATTDAADAVRIGALQTLQAILPAPVAGAAPATPDASRPAPIAALEPISPATGGLFDSLRRGLMDLAKPPTTTTPPPTSMAPRTEGPDQDQPGQRIYRRGVALTCLIVSLQNGKTTNLGSGLLASSDGLVITNHHVIEKAANLAVRCGDRESVARVNKRSKQPDLALLTTSLKSPEHFAFDPTYNQNLIGLEVFVIGNPYGLEGTFSTGIISGLREIDGVRYIQISAPISPGNSGGPVILRDGAVIGVATMGLKVGQNLNFAIASAEVIASGIFDPARMKVSR
ncbi:MAG: trypsin-like peptidase domain-containing protein [Candidatus Competibacteraceae bacterium]